MKTEGKLLLMIFAGLIMISCDMEENVTIASVCDQVVVISQDQYNTAPADPLTIVKAELEGDCLRIIFTSGGCSGDTWEVKLIDSGVTLYSDPPQRNLRLSLENREICSAHIKKEMTFDVQGLRIEGKPVLLNLTNSGTQLVYE